MDAVVVNLPVVWHGVAQPERRRFVIARSPSNPKYDIPGVDDCPWYVQEVTYGDDRDDYGRMTTHAGAVALVTFMLRGQTYGDLEEVS